MVAFVDVWKEAREDAYAVQYLGRNGRVRVASVYVTGLKSFETCYRDVDERFEVFRRSR